MTKEFKKNILLANGNNLVFKKLYSFKKKFLGVGKMEEIFKLGEKIRDFPIEIQSDTVIRIFYSDEFKVIKEIELLKIVGMTKTALKLSNGVLVTKKCLFPYHYKDDFKRGEEYYLLEKIKV